LAAILYSHAAASCSESARQRSRCSNAARNVSERRSSARWGSRVRRVKNPSSCRAWRSYNARTPSASIALLPNRVTTDMSLQMNNATVL
jgi:hypothetical protein